MRAAGSRVEVGDALVERRGRRALVVYGWVIAEAWSGPHAFEVVVAVLDDAGQVTRRGERFPVFPFTHAELDGDLRAAGLLPRTSTYADTADRYLVTAQAAVRPPSTGNVAPVA